MFSELSATERIAFQHNSQLANRIVAACSDFLSWIEKTRTSRIVDGKIPPVTVSRIKSVMDYAANVFSPTLTKVLFQELNMNVNLIVVSDIEIQCMALCSFRQLDSNQGIQINNMYSGVSSYDTINLNIFSNLDTKLDLDKGKSYEPDNNYIVTLIIFPVVFLGIEAFSNVESFTAEEIAAIILHECGHAVGCYEHVTDIYHRADVASNSVRYLNEKSDIKEALKVVGSMCTIEKSHSNKVQEEVFDQTLKELEKKRELLFGLHPVTTATILIVGAPIVAVVSGLIVWFLHAMFFSVLDRVISSGRYGKINDSQHKTSDTVVTMSNVGYEERFADEFVSRHGLGAALVSALKKIDYDGSAYHIRSNTTDAMKNHRTISKIISVVDATWHFFGMLTYVDSHIYDPLWLRLEHILHNNMVVFKDESLSDELRNHYIKETRIMMEKIAAMTNSNRHKINQMFWSTITRIISRTSMLDSFSTAGLSKDYDTLQLLTNGLIKNKLFFHSARLKSLQ